MNEEGFSRKTVKHTKISGKVIDGCFFRVIVRSERKLDQNLGYRIPSFFTFISESGLRIGNWNRNE